MNAPQEPRYTNAALEPQYEIAPQEQQYANGVVPSQYMNSAPLQYAQGPQYAAPEQEGYMQEQPKYIEGPQYAQMPFQTAQQQRTAPAQFEAAHGQASVQLSAVQPDQGQAYAGVRGGETAKGASVAIPGVPGLGKEERKLLREAHEDHITSETAQALQNPVAPLPQVLASSNARWSPPQAALAAQGGVRQEQVAQEERAQKPLQQQAEMPQPQEVQGVQEPRIQSAAQQTMQQSAPEATFTAPVGQPTASQQAAVNPMVAQVCSLYSDNAASLCVSQCTYR